MNTTHPYTPAVATDIRKTFARVRRKLAARDAAEQAADELMKRDIVQHLRAVGG